jgi:transcriptional regulator with XRE-family HTH domain
MTASEKVRRAIKGSGLTLNEIARRTGVNVGSLSRFTRGQVGISLRTFERLAEELGLTLTVVKRRKR